MNPYTVKLLKPGKSTEITYQGFELLREPNHLLIHARWERDALDLGYMTFEPGDHFYEHYYTDKWFNIFEIRSERGELKGWYCNVTKPAQVENLALYSEDLELDLFVSADRQEVVTLDEEEFEERGFSPEVRRAALNGLGELRAMAHSATPPFDSTSSHLSLGKL